MAEETTFTIGAEASCTDGPCGHVSRVVVDPLAQAVTHLVVEPAHRQGLGRLVPLDLVDATGGQVRLRCSQAEFEQLGSAEETEFVPGTRGYAEYGPMQVLSWPYYGLGGAAGVPGESVPSINQTVTYDAVPLGEVAIHRGDPVHATDGTIGQVQGLVMDRERLIQRVWGHDFYGDSRTIDVHVAWLREKLAGSSVQIQTVWGIGYKLVVTANAEQP